MIDEVALRAAVEQLITNINGLSTHYNEQQAEMDLLLTPLPFTAYHEDMGPVLWWTFPIEEPPYVGGPNDSDWTDDYYTHFTPLPQVKEPEN